MHDIATMILAEMDSRTAAAGLAGTVSAVLRHADLSPTARELLLRGLAGYERAQKALATACAPPPPAPAGCGLCGGTKRLADAPCLRCAP